MRCRDGRRVATVDELTVDGLNQVAVFGPGHTAKKHCSECDDMVIYDGDNAAVATFHEGSKYRFLSSESGHLGVFKAEATQDRRPCHATLAGINAKNAEFWKRPEEETT